MRPTKDKDRILTLQEEAIVLALRNLEDTDLSYEARRAWLHAFNLLRQANSEVTGVDFPVPIDVIPQDLAS